MKDYSHLNPRNTPIVEVEWQDIVSVENYNDDEDSQSIEVISVGYLLEDTPTDVKIAGSYVWREERWSDKQSFPKTPPEVSVVKDQANAPERKLTEIGEEDVDS